MKALFKLSLFITTIALSSCTSESVVTSTSSQLTNSTTREYAYSDVIDKTIFWDEVFSIDKDSYYVYFYSKTCSHCAELKNFIIGKALERNDIYFVQSSNVVRYTQDEQSVLGIDSIEKLMIVGYPSLLKIEFGKVCKNLVGGAQIKKELTL